MHALLLIALLVLTMTDPAGIEQPEDYEPVTSSASSLVDPYGDTRFSDVDDPSQEVWLGVGPGPAISGAFTGGLVNGDFFSGPRDSALPISDDNRIPGWNHVVVQGGGITAYWVDSATSPSGKAIEWRISNAVVNDEVYLEQYIRVSPRQQLKLPILRSTVGGDTDSLPEVRIQYLKRDGTTTTGTEQVGTLDATGASPQDVYALAGIPTDAAIARIRIVMTTAGNVTSDTVTFHEAWAGEPKVSYETWTFSNVTMPGTGADSLTAVTANSKGTPALLTEFFISPDAGQGVIGWVESIAVRMSVDRTAGTLAFQLTRVGGSNLGPTATINGTDVRQAWATANLVDTSDMLPAGAIFAVSVTGTGFTPTTADAFAVVRVAFVQLSTATGGAS